MITELNINGKAYPTTQTPAGNTVSISERGKILSVRRTTDSTTYAVWRSQKHFVGYGTLQDDGKLIVEVE